jgi:hypothetical protein
MQQPFLRIDRMQINLQLAQLGSAEFCKETNAEASPKKKMALLFRWYFIHSTHLAENWQKRHVDDIGEKLMNATALLLDISNGWPHQRLDLLPMKN